jgi:hypothetical protein
VQSGRPGRRSVTEMKKHETLGKEELGADYSNLGLPN